ncbi:MAG: S8 family serine peptidase [Ignavibacteria bacterium]|nr:S8 family serine peptidase [Ignavibacteria bacterium]
MKNLIKLSVLLFVFILSFSLFAQEIPDAKYWIIFKDKGIYDYTVDMTPGSEAYELAKSLLSERAINRRMKVLGEERLVDFRDLPLEQKYIDDLSSKGISIIAKSKWFNGVSAYLTPSQIDVVKNLDYVAELRLLGKNYKNSIKFVKPEITDYITIFELEKDVLDDKYDYGKSYKQMKMINVPMVHNLGIIGKGVMIASFDSGFEWRDHEATRNLNITDEYDFINKDPKTYNESNQTYVDKTDQSTHGTATLSNLAGFKPGKLIGPAFGSEIILAKTEYVPTETPMEEDFFLEATEWAEAKGVDVISTSLGYRTFDEPFNKNSYQYEHYNGRTAITTLAAARAVYLGVCFVASAGNNGQMIPPSLGSPGDGDSVISVGAVDLNGVIANFSSNGPTPDGRIKPDVVAPGVRNYVALGKNLTGNDSSYGGMNGTSFSCPLTAGVCALILSAHPELTPMQVREALRNTADRAGNPDNIYGWGLINAYKAITYWGPAWSNVPEVEINGDKVKISISVASKSKIEPDYIKILYTTEEGNENYISKIMDPVELNGDGNNSGLYTVTLENIDDPYKLRFFFTCRNKEDDWYYPIKYPFEINE